MRVVVVMVHVVASVAALLPWIVWLSIVWSLAAEYIDALWHRPVINVKALAPDVYAANKGFEMLTQLRARLIHCLVCDWQGDKECSLSPSSMPCCSSAPVKLAVRHVVLGGVCRPE